MHGWVHPKGADSMAISGLSFRNALVGSGWATDVLLSTNVLRKLSSHLAQHPFPVGKLFCSLGERLPAECHDYCKLVNGWVRFVSRTCRRWLQEHLCEVGG